MHLIHRLNRLLLRSLLPAIVLLAPPGGISPVHALSCTATISSMVFNGLDILSGNAVAAQGSVQINCTTTVLDIGSLGTVPVCPSINAGSGGSSASLRTLGGPGLLTYQLYQDADHQIPWGSVSNPALGTVPRINVSVTFPPLIGGGTGGGSASVPIYALLFGSQTAAPVGSYLSSFSGTQTSVQYGLLSLPIIGGCDAIGGLLSQTTTAPFQVSAAIEKNCLVSTLPLNFGSHGVLSSNVDGQGAVNVTCTGTTGYEVGLETGSFTATTRRMTNGGSAYVEYGLYRNSARDQPWGTGTQTVGGTGNGLTQSMEVFGRVRPQPTPPPGTYTDNVAVTVTY